MRTKDATFLALLQADELNLVNLVEIATATQPLRYALDTQARVWNGVSWTATAGGIGEIQESAEREMPSLRLVLQNMDGVLGPRVDPRVPGGEDLRGKRCTIYQACRDRLTGAPAADLVIETRLFVNSYTFIGREVVTFDLGLFPASEIRVPDRTCQGLRCRWLAQYRGRHCGYAGELETCEGTPEDCARHFVDEPLRFGGFPTSSGTRALRLA